MNILDGEIYSMATAGLGNDVHLVVQTRDQGLFYTVMLGSNAGLSVKDSPTFHQKPGSWKTLLNINSVVQGGPWLFENIACAFIADTLHVLGTNSIGGLHHTCRFSSGEWQSNWVEVIGGDPLLSGDPKNPGGPGVSGSNDPALGTVQCVGTLGGTLQVFFISGPGRQAGENDGDNGRLFLTTRDIKGSWSKPANVDPKLFIP